MIQCENNCACRPVCKEVENWKKYCEDHIRLRERSVLFDSEPSCPYYINKGCVANSIVDMGKGVIHSKDGSKTIIGDSPYDPKKQKENKVWTNKSNRKDEPYKISFGEIKCDNIDIVDEQLKNARSYKISCGHTEYSKLNNSTQDERKDIKESKEDDLDAQIIYYEDQPIAKIIIGKHNKENYSIPQICVPTKGLAKKIENELARRMNDIDKYIK